MTGVEPSTGGTAGETIARRIAVVRDQIAAATKRAGRDPDSVTLVAVSKQQPYEAVCAAVAAGQVVFGENYAQELVGKAEAAAAPVAAARPGHLLEWHFIGRLQRNKVAALAPHVALWHTVDRPELAAAIAARRPGAEVLVQVNSAVDPAKGGCSPSDVPALIERVRALGLEAVGLMTIPPATTDPRPHFAALRRLSDDLELHHASMGMSADFDVAIAEGATIVRIGSAIFGARTDRAHLQR